MINVLNIQNCNCIKNANITIVENSLNIKYGVNGTGKTTIGVAISIAVENGQEKLVEELCPYNSDKSKNDEIPKVSSLPYTKVKVFNEQYVNGYLFKGNGFFDDPFQVFLNSSECNQLMDKIAELLANLQGIFQKSESIHDLREFLPEYFNATKYKDGTVAKTGGIGEFIKGNGGGFENYVELDAYRPFYMGRKMGEVAKWAKWRRDGIDQMNGENCPFCTHEMENEVIESQNNVIKKVFKNSALSTANAVLEFLKKAVELDYIKADSIETLESYIGNKNKSTELFSELNQLGIETEYLVNKLERIYQFKPMNVTHEQLEEIENNLEDMKIDSRQISKFYSTNLIKELIENIEQKIEELKNNTRKLKNLFAAHERKLNQLVEARKEDINQFLALAGFPYIFELKPDGEKKALTYLVPASVEGGQVSEPTKHLSWGEKNAFALVMFMFEAISEEPDLIVLDDPISSFDTNKKFAVVRRLFDNKKNSFRDKTVLMLTHDLQPIIDYIHGSFFKRFGLTTPVNAMWIQNENGFLQEKNITQNDLKNIVELTRSIAENSEYPIAVRIVNLRKYIELTKSDFSEQPVYEVLSNLIHGRICAKDKEGNELKEDVFNNGCTEIQKFLKNMTYQDILDAMSDDELENLINAEGDYVKVIAFRLKFERDEVLFAKLRKKYPASYKFMNETNHIENDYVFQLDPLKFYSIPEFYLNELKKCIQEN
mgnify:CR=1 FL=1